MEKNYLNEKKGGKMNETLAMISRAWKFFICAERGKQYPAKQENPNSLCLPCLQKPREEVKK